MDSQPNKRPRWPKGVKPQPHDLAFKSLYGFRLMAEDLFEIVLRQELLDRINWATLERLPTEWFGPDLDRRLGDCVWRVQLRGGGSLIVPIEFQRGLDRLMPLRLSTYSSLLVEDLDKRGELDRGPKGRILPLVRPVVLYNGLRPWRSPFCLSALTPDGMGGWPEMTLLDMGRVSVEDLPKGNAVTAQVEALQGGLARDADGLLERMATRLGGSEHRALRSAFVEWVWHSVAPDLGAEAALLEPELMRIVELGEVREMKTLMMKSMVDHWVAEGRTEGEARVRADQRAQLRRQADRKFGQRAADRLDGLIRGVTDPERLVEVGDWIIDCRTEAEFLARAER
ncbi:MAG: Rpn family recombination-promoting nuclease/putative transposase [Gammaproteobacteria bacterium]|nr:Rpn family recombination-promoting nuclease/putative transposase [Gammaproteobacteria bacterium]MDE0270414.1 Rpn family recombination-promoting nuclease/putative transposase [Gammaproteobacteria bacterium]